MKLALAALLLVACAGDPDGPTIEGHGPVTVRVTVVDGPVAGVFVLLHGPAGDVQAMLTTDAEGTARGDLDTPGMITVVDPEVPSYLVTVTHVRADETIEVALDGWHQAAPGPQLGTITIEAPTTAPPSGTAEYAIVTPCTTTSTTSFPATLPLHAPCGATSVPIVVLASEPPGSLEDPGHNLAYVAGRVDAGATFTPGAWSTDCAQIDVRTDPLMSLSTWPRFGGTVFPHLQPYFCTLAPARPGHVAYPLLDFGEGLVSHAFTYHTTSLRASSILADHATRPDAIVVEQARDLLVGDIELERLDERGATWTRDAALDDADLASVQLTWTLSSPSFVAWRFIVPANTTTLHLPELPAALRNWNLASATSRTAELRFWAAAWTDDLVELHAQLAILDRYRVPATGTLREYREQFYPDAR
jgi:hypothetical protein